MNSQLIKPIPTIPAKGKPSGFTIASFVISLINMGAWLIPIAGIPLGILGFNFSYLGLQSSRNRLARTCVFLSCIGLFLAFGNALWGIIFDSQPVFLQAQTGLLGLGGN
jgi:hypothetical protein